MADNKKIIQDYLKKVAEQDPVFAEKLADPNKSIDKCFEYIRSQARRQAVSGCAMIEDKVVFGWATHYYCEDKVETPVSTALKIKKAETPEQKPKAAKIEEKQPKKRSFVQLSLFE